MNARPVGDGDGQDELRDLLMDPLSHVMPASQVWGVADALLPVVTAWAEQRARERVAETCNVIAGLLDACGVGDKVTAKLTTAFARLAAVAADDRTGQP